MPNSLDEFQRIARFARHLKYRSPQVLHRIGDDCAVFAGTRGACQVLSCDALVENVHFKLATTTPEQLGEKALAVNLSDIAAMGANPRLALISLGLPRHLPITFLDAFYRGIDRICRRYEVELVGGDTVASPRNFFINITVLGEAARNRLFTRSGARPGDALLVTGTLGDSALGLKILKSPRKSWKGPETNRKRLIRRHLTPTPRVEEARLLAASRFRVTAMIDVSDGLLQDLGHLLSPGGLGADLRTEALPLSRDLVKVCNFNKLSKSKLALSGGEDYELLFTLDREDVTKLRESFVQAGRSVTPVGEITRGSGIRLIDARGRVRVPTGPGGYKHF